MLHLDRQTDGFSALYSRLYFGRLGFRNSHSSITDSKFECNMHAHTITRVPSLYIQSDPGFFLALTASYVLVLSSAMASEEDSKTNNLIREMLKQVLTLQEKKSTTTSEVGDSDDEMKAVPEASWSCLKLQRPLWRQPFWQPCLTKIAKSEEGRSGYLAVTTHAARSWTVC